MTPPIGLTADPLSPGDWIAAIFPRMAGKARPGLVAAVQTAGGRAILIATPATSRRTNQASRLALPPDCGLDRPSQLIPPLTAAIPATAVTDRLGRASPEALSALEAALAHWFGPDWARVDPRPSTPRVLHPLSPSARRRAARPPAIGTSRKP